MIKIKNVKIYGLEESIKRSGYPMQCGEPDDFGFFGVLPTAKPTEEQESVWQDNIILSDKDWNRAEKLSSVRTGTGHDNFLKGIVVQFDLKYPLYFTKQLQRYHFIDFVSSQSTMHSVTKRGSIAPFCNKYVEHHIIELVNLFIQSYNNAKLKEDKYFWFMKIVSNLPSGFELWAGMTTNYLQLKTIYQQRKKHKLKEDWGEFCEWIETLPYFRDWVIKEKK